MPAGAVELAAWNTRRIDPTDEVAAEISAAQNISHARAVGQISYGRALCERLPAVATVFARGVIDFRMVLTIIARTHNVEDTVIAEVDAVIARHAEKWMKLSTPKLTDRIDLWVATIDPAAVRVPPVLDDTRCLDVDPASVGLAFVAGHVRAADGAALDQRLAALAATVCEHDPRTTNQRRADACGPLARGEATLACECGRADCAAGDLRAAATTAVIHVLAEHATLEGTSDTPGYLPGFGILPAESVRQLAATATLTPVPIPTQTQPDPGYRPSAKTVEFLRWRDLTCRWPGCDQPARTSDIDHTVPYPAGPTHPSNTKAYCRTHHLIKTFCTGPTRLDRSAAPRRHHRAHRPHRTRLHHATPRRRDVPRPGPTHQRPAPTPTRAPASIRPGGDDAAPQTDPRPRPPRPDHRRTPPTHPTHRRPRTPTPSLAGHQLPTPTLLNADLSTPLLAVPIAGSAKVKLVVGPRLRGQTPGLGCDRSTLFADRPHRAQPGRPERRLSDDLLAGHTFE